MGQSIASFALYPNPTNGNFTLIQKGEKAFGNVRVEIYTMNGNKVRDEQMTGEKIHEFRLTEIPADICFPQ